MRWIQSPAGFARPRVGLAVFAAFLLFLILTVPVFYKVWQLDHEKERLQDEVNWLTGTNQRLEYELKLLKEDPEFWEQIARQKLKRGREGEVVYKLVPPESDAPSGESR